MLLSFFLVRVRHYEKIGFETAIKKIKSNQLLSFTDSQF